MEDLVRSMDNATEDPDLDLNYMCGSRFRYERGVEEIFLGEECLIYSLGKLASLSSIMIVFHGPRQFKGPLETCSTAYGKSS